MEPTGENNVQVRTDDGGLYYFPTIGEAVRFVSKTPEAIKVSFSIGRERKDSLSEERVRLIRVTMPDGGWGLMFEPVAAHLQNEDGSPILEPGELNHDWKVDMPTNAEVLTHYLGETKAKAEFPEHFTGGPPGTDPVHKPEW